MTYRSDHDAALARIDALEVELGRARAEIRQREREDRRRDPNRFRAAKLVVATAAVALFFGLYALLPSNREPSVIHITVPSPPPPQPPPQPPPPQPPPPQPPPPQPSPVPSVTLLECTREPLDRAIAKKTASSKACIAQIRRASTDPILGDGVHDLLVRWLGAEEAIGHSKLALRARDSLAPEIRNVITYSFTR
jgi:hypothetical protein